MDGDRLFSLGLGPYCVACPWLETCGAAETERACRRWGPGEPGGINVLHPALPITEHYLAEVGGPGFDEIVAQPVPARQLPSYLPRIRYRSNLRGQLSEPIYAISIDDVLTRTGIRSAGEIRDFVGLDDSQELVLLLFGRDPLLQRLWREQDTLLKQVAQGGYIRAVAPSYSAWSPRPRVEFMYMAKRSLIVFHRLQELGAQAIPRLVWEIPHDVRRWARWLQANPQIDQVALDIATYRVEHDFTAQVEGLARLDQLTERRLTYLINGPTTYARAMAVFEAVSPERVSLTSGHWMARPPGRDQTFSQRCATDRRTVENARDEAKVAGASKARLRSPRRSRIWSRTTAPTSTRAPERGRYHV